MATATLTRNARTPSVPTGDMNTPTQGGACACHGRPWADLLLRKSKVVREGERALSIRAQEERGRAWADEHEYCVRKVWKENLSAWSDVRRPKYDAAMSAVLNGEVPALWCYALDRFSRKGAESVVPILGKARVIFDYERLDSMDERDRRWIIDRAENAREYSQRLSHNVTTTKGRQRNEGRWLAKAPFGLTAHPDTRRLSPNHTPYTCLVSTREEVTPWQVVECIFNAVAAGTAARALARMFNRIGLRTITGAQWRAPQILKILHHPVYEGWLTVAVGASETATRYMDANGSPVRCVEPSTLPEMIPSALASKARRVLAGAEWTKPKPKDGLPVHALSGKLICAGCNGAMTKSGRGYRCDLTAEGGVCAAPTYVMQKPLEAYVVDLWSTRLHASDDDDPLLIAVAERWQQLQRPSETAEVKEARAELKAASAQLDKFHADDRAGFYSGRSAKYRIPTKIAAEKRLDAAEDKVRELTGEDRVDITFLIEGKAAKTWEAAAPQLRRDLLGLAIDRVIVSKSPGKGKRFVGDERVTVVWADPEGAEPDTDEFEQAA